MGVVSGRRRKPPSRHSIRQARRKIGLRKLPNADACWVGRTATSLGLDLFLVEHPAFHLSPPSTPHTLCVVFSVRICFRISSFQRIFLLQFGRCQAQPALTLNHSWRLSPDNLYNFRLSQRWTPSRRVYRSPTLRQDPRAQRGRRRCSPWPHLPPLLRRAGNVPPTPL